jgi:hypothetical protein
LTPPTNPRAPGAALTGIKAKNPAHPAIERGMLIALSKRRVGR